MWCTRDNRIIRDCGHEIIQFNQNKLKGLERRHPHLLHVYDIQENDTRILNLKTYDKDSVIHYLKLSDVIIPEIKTRFEIDTEIKIEKELNEDLKSVSDNFLNEPNLTPDDLTTDIDDIFN